MHLIIKFTASQLKLSLFDLTEVGIGFLIVENNEVNTEDQWRYVRKFGLNLFVLNLSYTCYYEHE